MGVEQRVGIQVLKEENRKRLEDLLFDRFRALSKLYLRELIKSEKCEVNGRFENRGFRLRANDFVELEMDPDRENSMVPQDIPLNIIYEDTDVVIVDKPVGMLVHPSHRDKSGTILNALSHYLNPDPDATVHIRPGLIHRLDRDTSGLLAIAKHGRSHRILATQFEKKTVEKKYLALVEGVIAADAGEIDSPIGRFYEEKKWDVKEDGRHALSRYKVLQRYTDSTLIEFEPVTGRTNQLRIHAAVIGHPILGDVSRGGREYSRLCLHAYRLTFRHPSLNTIVTFESPADFANIRIEQAA